MKMLNQEQFDKNIKKALLNKSQDIVPSDNMFENIKSEITSNRSDKYMSKEKFLPFSLNIKKTVIAASCGFLILAGSVVASPNLRASALQSIGKYVNGYTDMKHYDKAPSKADLQKDLGYSVKIPDSLSGGYKLVDSGVDGHIDGATPDNQYGNRGAYAIYSINNDRKTTLSLGASKRSVEADAPIFKNAVPVKMGSITGYFTQYKVHEAPEGTKFSAKEKQDIKDGKEVLIGMGSPKKNVKLKEKFSQECALKWKDNGINYELTSMGNLSESQMSELAQYVISSK
ncbi:hypothetical protein [Clostridium sp. 001]|uniref:hypothetical protein n=1 Tax=Clostridium sp. 001 TaxID=1970093 RepID=UPI001C2C1604|nr:hypothetical protein [Clostridium sp. 001]QXE17947.1 hypothetical protein B5S50_03285 [Clostridium sp. 001]